MCGWMWNWKQMEMEGYVVGRQDTGDKRDVQTFIWRAGGKSFALK